MNYLLYNTMSYLLSPLIWIYFGWRAFRSQDYREGFWQRIGFDAPQVNQSLILVHCASVGEAKAAIPLIRELQSSYPKFGVLVTTSSPTGKQVIIEAFGKSVIHRYIPIDWSGSCRRLVNKLPIKLAIVMETEIWPNWIKALHNKKIPILLANARLAERSLQRYLKKKKFFQQVFSQIDRICAQYPTDLQRFSQIYPQAESLSLSGNIKFDLSIEPSLLNQQQALRASLADRSLVWVAASIHPGEFAAIIEAHRALLEHYPDALLIGIPRHPEKFQEFTHQVSRSQLRFSKRSNSKQVLPADSIYVGDTMGEVLLFCGAADIAFIGGSLVNKGGHNPLEATVCGAAVLYGESNESFYDICLTLEGAGCLMTCMDSTSLTNHLLSLAKQPQKLAEMKLQASHVMEANRGALQRLMKRVEELLPR